MTVPAPAELALVPEADLSSVLRVLTGALTVHPASSRSSDRILLDTFDGRIRAAGWTAWRDFGPAGDGTVSLALEGPPGGALAGTARPARRDRILAAEVTAAPLRHCLEPVLEERALLPRVRVRAHVQAFNVCNRDAKTVVRMLREDGRVVVGAGEVPLPPRLKVTPVLGYGREFARVMDLLTGRGHLKAVSGPLADQALRAAGLDPGGCSAAIDVEMNRAMPAGEAMLAVCQRLAAIVDANLPGVVDDLDPEFLHDLRVAVRRTRSVLKEMGGVLDSDVAGRSATDLRWIQEITGPTRDLDVLLHSWPGMTDPVPAEMAADLEPLELMLGRHRAAAFSAMRAQLRGRRFRVVWDAWTAVVDGSGSAPGPAARRPVGDLAAGRITSVYRAMVKMGSAIDDASPPQALHDLRKRGKELRYLLELFGGMWPAGRVKPLVASLKGLQDVLGHFQDDEIQVAELRSLGPELAAAPGGTDSLIALGFVLDGLSANQREARRAFASRFAEFTRPATRSAVKTTFGGRRERR